RYIDIAHDTMEAVHEINASEVLVVGQGDSIVVDQIPAIFDVLLRGRVAYRFVDGESAAVFPANRSVALVSPDAGEAAGWYGAWPTRELRDGFRLVELDGSWPQVPPWSEDPLEPVGGPRTFQNGIEFQHYAWEAGQEGSGRFWLQWQVLWLSPDDTHFFVQVLDGEERLWGRQDSAGYPTEFRQKGDRVLTRFDITISEGTSGMPHWGRAGTYLYPQVVNVPVIDNAGNPVGDTVVMGPLSGEP
ncbi:MAG: hypothetical protein PVF77_08375, partial [Anaerolineae bacterium]